MTTPGAAAPAKPRAHSWGRALVVVLLCAGVALLLSVDEVYEGLQRALFAAEPLIARHPFLGAVAFVLLAAMSAVLAFFSSALLLPAAVYAWGNAVTFGLLWLGWLLGGICTYALGRGLRGPQGRASKTSSQFDFYIQRAPGEVTFTFVLLGAGVVHRDVGVLVVFGLVGAALSLYALRMLHRRLDQLS